MASYGTSGTHDVKETVRRAEVVKTTKLEPTVPAPPRPSEREVDLNGVLVPGVLDGAIWRSILIGWIGYSSGVEGI